MATILPAFVKVRHLPSFVSGKRLAEGAPLDGLHQASKPRASHQQQLLAVLL